MILDEDLARINDFGSAKIIVTSISHDKERILAAGADIYLPKPYEVSQLVRWVEQLIDP